MSEPRIDREYYDESEYFDAGTDHLTDPDSPFQRYRVAKVLEIHEPGSGDRVLDLGCGWGTFELALAPRVAQVVGVDFSTRSIDLCRARVADAGLENVRLLRADAADTGLEEGSFDVVLAADLLEHLYPDDSARVAREAWRVLRPGGRFVVWAPHCGHLVEILRNRGIVGTPDPTHVDYKSMERVKEILAGAGFEVEKAYWVESHLPGLRILERALMRWVPWLRRRIAALGRKGSPRTSVS